MKTCRKMITLTSWPSGEKENGKNEVDQNLCCEDYPVTVGYLAAHPMVLEKTLESFGLQGDQHNQS